LKNLSTDNIAALLKTAPEILGKDKYFNSAVLIPLFKGENQLHVLFEKRANAIRQGGEVSFPGGEFDPGKDRDLQETALRETTEEIGIEKDKIRLLGKLGTLVAPMGVAVDAYIAYLIIEDISRLPFDRTEVEKVFSLPLEYFLNNEPEKYNVRLEVHPNEVDANGNEIKLLPVKELGLPNRYSRPWTKGRHRILVYKTAEEVVWGITAEIIFEFSKIINNK
jgi:8-oxo-dGTP pyrophosphatase MutT (NUDIX family)